MKTRKTVAFAAASSRSASSPTARRKHFVEVLAQTANVTESAKQAGLDRRSEEHTSELQSLMRISYAVFCLKKKKYRTLIKHNSTYTDTSSPTYTLHKLIKQHNRKQK